MTSNPNPLAEKLRRLGDIAAEQPDGTLEISDRGDIAWLLGGRHLSESVLMVAIGGSQPVAHVLEADAARLRDLLGRDWQLREVPWWNQGNVATSQPPGVQGAVARTQQAVRLRAARAMLTPAELDSLFELGDDAVRVIECTLCSATPGSSEHEVARRVVNGLYELGIELDDLRVGGERQLRAGIRRPRPTTAPLGDRALLSVSVRRDGVACSFARARAMTTPLTEDETRRDAAVRRIAAAGLGAMNPGSPIGQLLRAMAGAYVTEGFTPTEFERGPQATLVGTSDGELVVPAADPRIVMYQAIALHPTVGAYPEDPDAEPDEDQVAAAVLGSHGTYVTTDSGIEAITVTDAGAWPTVDGLPLTLQP